MIMLVYLLRWIATLAVLLLGITTTMMILGISLLAAIVDLGAPLNYHLILGAGVYTFVYILARAFGKYFGAMLGAQVTHLPGTVKKYFGEQSPFQQHNRFQYSGGVSYGNETY